MPTYDYQCPACASLRTLNRTIAMRNDLVPCDTPECPEPYMKLKISMPAVQFNGPGFPGNDGKVTNWAKDKWDKAAAKGKGLMSNVTEV